jgi:hypothetical protein
VTAEELTAISYVIQEHNSTPDWVCDLLTKAICEGALAPSISVEEKTVTQSYIDFLSRMVELKPRGELHALHAIQLRDSLSPHIGRKCVYLWAMCDTASFSAWFDEQLRNVIHAEVFGGVPRDSVQ